MVNVCPKCHSVTYGNKGWMYANKYNSTRFCLCCGTAMDGYKDGWLNDDWIQYQIELHESWLEENGNKFYWQ